MSSSPILSSSIDAANADETAPEPAAGGAADPFAALADVRCGVDFVLGSGTLSVRDCLRLERHSVIRLTQSAGADLTVSVNGVSVATGEVVIVDENTALRICRILPPPGIEAA